MKILDIFCQFHNSNYSPPPHSGSLFFNWGSYFLKKRRKQKELRLSKDKKGNDEEEPIVFISSLLGHFGMMETTTLAQEQILYIFPVCSFARDVGGRRIVLTSRNKVLVCMAPDQGAQGARQCLVCFAVLVAQ